MRKTILAIAKRSSPDRMLARSKEAAVRAAQHAALVSHAYRTLLAEHGIDVNILRGGDDLTKLPILTKENTFERFKLVDLCRPTALIDFADVLTSSGRGGTSFGFRITTRKLYEKSWFDTDLGLQDAFNVDSLSTLLINCLPMGVVLSSRAVTVANLSVREDMACAILRDVGRMFPQTLLCTDPLFIRQLLDQAKRSGIDWRALNTSVVIGEEVLGEAQRDYIAVKMGIDLDGPGWRTIISSFGVGELGLNLLFETRETVRMRRAMRTNHDVANILRGSNKSISLPSIFCFSPQRCHVEVLNPDGDGFGELCFTMLDRNAVIPLPRYVTGDLGKLIAPDATRLAAGLAKCAVPWLPIVSIKGRIKDRNGLGPSVEDIKEIIYLDHAVADQLSGAFRIAHPSGGPATVMLQARGDTADAGSSLTTRLRGLAQEHGIGPIHFEVMGSMAFPFRPVLDFERKFSYLSPPAAQLSENLTAR